MRLIKQEDDFGCGVACVASLLEIDYQKALSLFWNGTNRALNEGFYCREIVKALNSSRLNYEFKYIKLPTKRKIYKPCTIVFVRRSKKYPAGHYLLRTENGWMDSWINFPEKPIKAGFLKRLPEKPIYGIFTLD